MRNIPLLQPQVCPSVHLVISQPISSANWITEWKMGPIWSPPITTPIQQVMFRLGGRDGHRDTSQLMMKQPWLRKCRPLWVGSVVGWEKHQGQDQSRVGLTVLWYQFGPFTHPISPAPQISSSLSFVSGHCLQFKAGFRSDSYHPKKPARTDYKGFLFVEPLPILTRLHIPRTSHLHPTPRLENFSLLLSNT